MAFSRWKNALVSPAAALKAAQGRRRGRRGARVSRATTTRSRAYHAVDFDDLIALPIALLGRGRRRSPRNGASAAGTCWSTKYQDTNPAQYRLMRLLVGERASFTAVGDDDQAIYGWRGASRRQPGAAARRTIPSLNVIKLEQNYRSTVRILRSANALIAHNPKLFTTRSSGASTATAMRSAVTPAADDEAEAEGVVRRLLAHRFEHRGRYADYAILYRGNHQAKVFEQQLRAQNVPYEISGGQSYFERAEIKDLDRVSAPDRQRRRRSRVHPRGDDAEARRRRDDAGEALGDRAATGTRACSPRCSTPRRPRSCPRGSARSSTRSAR